MTARNGDWMQTFSGRQFWPLDPRAEDVTLPDIAHALANMCRFGGHSKHFYSVAEHSVRVSRLAPEDEPRRALAALLHDAAEAYCVDVPRPLKRFLNGYKEIESRIARAIEERFGVDEGALDDARIKAWDERLLATEARDIMGGQSAGKRTLHATPLGERIYPVSSAVAKDMFLDRFYEISAEMVARGEVRP